MNKNQLNDVVFEALFRQAVIDEFEEEIRMRPSNEELSNMYTFSQKFEAHMKKIFKKDNRKVFINKIMLYTKKAAVILLILLGCVFSILLFNEEVQATVNKIIIEIYEKFNSIIYKGEQTSFEEKNWILNYLPQGYIVKSTKKLGNGIIIDYENDNKNIITFTYSPDIGSTNISIDNENHEVIKCKTLGEDAYCAIAKNSKFDNMVVWDKENYIFYLNGKEEIDELIKMAESLTEK
jgi:hypothetical protein